MLARVHRLARVPSVVVLVAVLGSACAASSRPDVSDQRFDRRSARAATTSIASTVPSTAVPLPLSGKVIHVDAGHNGQNSLHPEINDVVDIGTQYRACDTTGTSTDDGYRESEFNIEVASRLVDLLRGQGATVVMTRVDDAGWGPCITERAAIGNRVAADVAISIHADGGPSWGRGFHVIYPANVPGLTDDIAEPSFQLALDVREAYRLITTLPDANYIGMNALDERNDLGGLNLSDVPKVFIEAGNMRNADDAELLKSADFRQRVAEALASGLSRYLTGSHAGGGR